MNALKDQNRNEARKRLTAAGLDWKSFNNDCHWKINEVDFWPTTHKWLCPLTGEVEYGIKELIAYLKPKSISVKKITIEQMFEIAKKVKPMNLHAVCEALHKEIYK